jgi:hypothetical protein
MRLFRVLGVAASIAAISVAGSLAPLGVAQAGVDYGNWGNWMEWGHDFVDEHEDPSDYAVDADYDYEPDDVLAMNLTRASLAIAHKLGFQVTERRYLKNFRLELVKLRPPYGMTSRKAMRALREADPEGYYGFNPVYRLAGEAANAACEGTRCYGQTLIGWQPGGCAAKARIAMIDSAVDTSNPALAGRRLQYKRVSRGTIGKGESDHGTAVAAMLVGAPGSAFPGLLPDAELVAADVFSLDRSGQPFTDAARLTTGLDWVAGYKPMVINISIAGPDGVVLRTAIHRLAAAGIPVVAAAGNLGPRAPPQFPAAYPEVTAVTAVDRDLKIYRRANHGSYVALSAPGVGIWTAGAGGAGVFREGTSFAAPFATAATAVLKTRQPKLAPAALRAELERQARDLGPPGNDPIFGWGLLQTLGCAGERQQARMN